MLFQLFIIQDTLFYHLILIVRLHGVRLKYNGCTYYLSSTQLKMCNLKRAKKVRILSIQKCKVVKNIAFMERLEFKLESERDLIAKYACVYN